MAQAIIFDFWGTLVEQGVWSPIKQVKKVLEIDLPFPEYVDRMEHAFMTSTFNNLKEAFEAVCREFKVEPEEEKIEQLIGLWNKSWILAKPYPETEQALAELKERYRLILMSNTDCFSVNSVLEKYNLSTFFEEKFFSYQLNLIKTDKLFLKQVLTKSNLMPSEVLVVGDSIQSDIIPAKRLGIKAILMDRNNTRDFSPKIKDLKELEKEL